MDLLLILVRTLLVGVFALAGVTKLRDLPGARQAMRDFGLPPAAADLAGVGLPWAELVIAGLLVGGATAWWGALGGLVLLIAFIGGIAYQLARGRTPNCHCFGQLYSKPIGRSTLIRNGVLAVGAALVVLRGPAPMPGLFGWVADLSVGSALLVAVTLVLTGAVAGLGWMVLNLLRQNGRLLLRIEALETHVGLLPASVEADADAPGLPIGAPIPDFQLTGLDAQPVAGTALVGRGKPTLLLFTSPTCGPCIELLPEIANWQRDHAAKLEIVPVYRGDAAAVRAKTAEHGLANVYLQQENEVGKAFGVTGTPSAVLVDGAGLIRSPLAGGAGAVRDLVLQSTRPLDALRARLVKPAPIALDAAPHPTVPAGPLPPGTAAPPVRLPDLDGQPVDLAQWHGQPLLLIFWNPGCGFCRKLLPDLKAWEAAAPPDAPQPVLISSGTVEVNRSQGLAAPILLDEGFRTGFAFGARGTPSAVRIDAQGRLASPVVVGTPAVLELLGPTTAQPAPLSLHAA